MEYIEFSWGVLRHSDCVCARGGPSWPLFSAWLHHAGALRYSSAMKHSEILAKLGSALI